MLTKTFQSSFYVSLKSIDNFRVSSNLIHVGGTKFNQESAKSMKNMYLEGFQTNGKAKKGRREEKCV